MCNCGNNDYRLEWRQYYCTLCQRRTPKKDIDNKSTINGISKAAYQLSLALKRKQQDKARKKKNYVPREKKERPKNYLTMRKLRYDLNAKRKAGELTIEYIVKLLNLNDIR